MKVFGLLIDWVSSEYHQQIWEGIHSFCRDRGVNLLTLVIGSMGSQFRWEQMRNQLLELLDGGRIDGFLVNTASLTTPQDQERFAQLLDRIGPAPVVSLGNRIPGTAGVVIDGEPGFRQILDHLYGVHGYRKFAFAGGQPSIRDAVDRKRIFLDFLTSHGLEARTGWILDGEFSDSWGDRAVDLLIPDRAPGFEVLVCADDEIARGALGALARKQLQVPWDVAVTGFDDVRTAGASALTTARQPLVRLGWDGARQLLALVEGQEVLPEVRLETSLVVRQSCGCLSRAAAVTLGEPVSCLPSGFGGLTGVLRDQLLGELSAEGLPPDLGSDLLGQFTRSCVDGDHRIFLRGTGAVAMELERRNLGPGLLHYPLAVLRRWVPGGPGTLRDFAEKLLHQARILTADIQVAQTARRETGRHLQQEVLSEINQGMVFSRDFRDQVSVLLASFPLLGIGRFQMILYQDQTQPLRTARLVLTDRGAVEGGGVPYDPRRLFPPGFEPGEEPWAYVVEALFESRSPLGFFLLDSRGDTELLGVFDQLCERIGRGVENIYRFQNLEDQVAQRTSELKAALSTLETNNLKLKEMALRDELTGLYNRRGFLTLAEHQLKAHHRRSRAMTLFFGDLDGLKVINDTWGHEAGDQAIQTAGNLLVGSFRTDDVVARLGGDEFIILATWCAPGDAAALVNRINRAFARHDQGRYRISLGWIGVDPQADKTLAEWMKEADEALYRDKQAKRRARGTGPGLSPTE